jgi:hypothetical protein
MRETQHMHDLWRRLMLHSGRYVLVAIIGRQGAEGKSTEEGVEQRWSRVAAARKSCGADRHQRRGAGHVQIAVALVGVVAIRTVLGPLRHHGGHTGW